MMRRLWAVAGLLLLIGSSGPSVAQESPTDFLRQVYARYRPEGRPFNPLGEAAPAIFSPVLLALIRHDQAAARGEAGRLDHDPICDCQDAGSLTSFVYSARQDGAGRSIVSVSFKNGAAPASVVFTLANGEHGWRIDDVAETAISSLRRFLQAS